MAGHTDRTRRAVALAIALLSLSAIAGAAQAAFTRRAAGTDVRSARVERTHPRRYWTAARMRSAHRLDALTRRGRVDESGVARTRGAVAGSYPPRLPATGAGDRVDLAFPVNDYTVFPESVTGRIFFHDPGDGLNYACSGSAVDAPNLSVVWTAGHCAYDTTYGVYMTNWIFVPQYQNGSTPQGIWTATQLFTVSGWTDLHSQAYDMAAAVVSKNAGSSLVDTVGGLGIEWNVSNQQTFTALGYPADPAPYDGKSMLGCTSAVLYTDASFTPNPMGISCDMGHGSSGGPWIEQNQYLNSNTSYSYSGLPGVLFGPYFGDAAATIFSAAGSFGLTASPAPTVTATTTPSVTPTASTTATPSASPTPSATPTPQPTQSSSGGGGGGGGGGNSPTPSPTPSAVPTQSAPTPSEAPSDSPTTVPTPQPTMSLPPPPASHAVTVTLHLRAHRIARGRVSATDGFGACIDRATVNLFRRYRGAWRLVKRAMTDPVGDYNARLHYREGRYIAYVPSVVLDSSDTCGDAQSIVRTVLH